MFHVSAERVIGAPPDAVFGIITDRTNHHKILPGVYGRLIKPGEKSPQGLGAVHRIGVAGRIGPTEQVVEYAPPTRFAYHLIGGLPLRDHHGIFDIAATPDGRTLLRFTMSTRPPVPVPGVVAERLIALGLHVFLAGVARAARRF